MSGLTRVPRETMMPPSPSHSFWAKSWRKLEPHALSFVIESGVDLRYWLVVLVAHLARIAMSAAGIDMWLVDFVGWMEKVVFLASFASLFWRVLIGLYNETKRGKL